MRRCGDDAADGAGLVVDALFGAGLSKPLDEAAWAPLGRAAQAGTPIVAVDLPSGLPGDRAAPLGHAPQCALTVTFHRKKPAHVLEPGRSLCGEVVVADIGLAPPERAVLFENGPALWSDLFPWPATGAYKHSRGWLMVVSGPMTHTGAARLAARAGLRIGAGLVTVLSPSDAVPVNAASLEAVMLTAFGNDGELADAAAKASAAVIGPRGRGRPRHPRQCPRPRRDRGRPGGRRRRPDQLQGPAGRLFEALDARDVLTPHPRRVRAGVPRPAEGLAGADHRRPARRPSGQGRWCCSRAPIR